MGKSDEKIIVKLVIKIDIFSRVSFMANEGIPDNVCIVPLGNGPCKCGNGDMTWFVQTANFDNIGQSKLTYTFDDHPNYILHDMDAWKCMYVCLSAWLKFQKNGVERIFTLTVNEQPMTMFNALALLGAYRRIMDEQGLNIRIRKPNE